MPKTQKEKVKKSSETPLMKQYFQIKGKYPDALLLFRVGDFYETFGEDAITTSEVLGIVLTSRNNGGSDIELAGFPHHSLDVYMPKLIKAGYRVAVCDQLEKPSKEKKIVKRGVTELVTPGLTIDENILDRRKNNFLSCLHFQEESHIGLALLDISTGEFYVTEGNAQHIRKILDSFSTSELIFSKSNQNELNWIDEDIYTYPLEQWYFSYDFCREKLLDHFGTASLKGFGIEEHTLGQVAAGVILQYLEQTENRSKSHILKIQRLESEDFVWLDRFTFRNLELLQTTHPTGISLIEVLDKCVSPMGSRMLRKWISMPLLHINLIRARLDAIEDLRKLESRAALGSMIKSIGDMERLISKISSRKINPREIVQLKKSLESIPEIARCIDQCSAILLKGVGDTLNNCPNLIEQINTKLKEDPPNSLNKGDIFKEGFSPELDEYKYLIKNNKKVLLELQQRETEKTGISGLKVGFNNVFGYYLEVTNRYKDLGLIPDDWIRKQTLKGAERYITEELKVVEEKILGAQENITRIEHQLYEELVDSIQQYIEALSINSQSIAKVDCLLSLALVSMSNKYNKPIVTEDYKIDIKEGRHPVIECQLDLGDSYVPNDIYLDIESQQVMLITGPNMSGKSALLRQTALICLMAQMGSYVPATTAEIGLLDRIFTRVGASDNLSKGESTFMVEMNETAGILNNMTNRSLILLDEIGRGTSTYDGISLAWSIAEYIHDNGFARPKTLFATHYHELNQLESSFERIRNYCIEVKEVDKKIVFLRNLTPGASEHSFGIHVAQMAGMPKSVLYRAQQLLSELEQKSLKSKDNNKQIIKDLSLETKSIQLQIFDQKNPALDKIHDALSSLDVDQITPLEALMKIQSWKAELKGSNS